VDQSQATSKDYEEGSQKEIEAIVEEKKDNWMTLIIKCQKEGVWLEDKVELRTLRMKIIQYVMKRGVLFKKGYLVPMLRCVGPLQANYVIREIHMGACGMHSRGKVSNSRFDVEASEDTDDVNHGSMALLSMRDGHFGFAASIDKESKVCHCGHRLFHKVDQSQATSKDYEEGSQKKEGRQWRYGRQDRKPRWNNIITKRQGWSRLGRMTMSSEGMKPAGLRTEVRWGRNGKGRTR
nr:reverse transcriptase domain-containing protein [Tanacetum cinerariifolium]